MSNTSRELSKRSIVAHSHLHPAAYDCGVYLQHRVPELQKVPFVVELDAHNMWKLIFCADLDKINGEIDIQFTHHIVDQARAFITGRGGMCMAQPRVLSAEKQP